MGRAMTTTSALTRLRERREQQHNELVANPRDWPGYMIQRALLAEEIAHERNAERRALAAIELEETDRDIRAAWPNSGDPAFRALFVRDTERGDRDLNRPWPAIEGFPELRAIGTATSNAPNHRSVVTTLWATLAQHSPIIRLATVVPTPTGEPTLVSFTSTDGPSNGIVADGASIGVVDPVFNRVPFQTAFAYKDRTVLSSELFENDEGAFDAEGYAVRNLVQGGTILRSFGVHCMTGDGSGKPSGIAASGIVSTTTAASATVLALDDVAACIQASAVAAVQDDFAMLLSLDALGDLFRATDGTGAAGGRSIQPGSYQGTLYGIPVFLDGALGATSTGSIVAVMAAWKSAYMVRIAPTRIDVDRSAMNATDQVGVRAVLRADGQPLATGMARSITMA